MTLRQREDIRNIAIIAHVDHGKTTLVDQFLKQAGAFRANEHVEERALDTNDLERERGITILAKNTAVRYKGVKLNIVDTPGHADFSGEVERILSLVDGVLLVVDAFEGPMPQTKFVLRKALERRLKPIVVINKIDRENARPEEVADEILDLFIELEADDDQLDFPVIYTSAVRGTAGFSPDHQEDNMEILFQTILKTVPGPQDLRDEPLQMQVAILDYNEYVGRIGIGRIYRGKIRTGDDVIVKKLDGSEQRFRVTKMFGFFGLKRDEIEEAGAGDIIALSGMEDINVGETICSPDHAEPLPPLVIDEPTMKMTFLVNNSPFAGREGKFLTARKIEERLMRELHTDVSLRVEPTDSPDAWIVSGRGELHLSILIETMRREGYEFQVSKPEVIMKAIDGVLCEPFERVIIETPEEYVGAVIESLGRRKGEMIDMVQGAKGQARLEFLVPTRGLIGYQTEFMSITRGYGVYSHSFEKYMPKLPGDVGRRRQGVLIALESGRVTTYGIMQVEDRGTIFVEPGTEVYAGMIVGEHNRENDLTVNICKAKHQSNVRSATKDQTAVIKKPRIFSLEEALQYLDDDEYCEVTPKSIRMRKKILDKTLRERTERRKKMQEQG